MQRSSDWTIPCVRATGGGQRAHIASAAGIIAMALAGCTSGPAMQPQVAAVKPGGAEQPGASTADLNQIRNSLRQRALLEPVR